MKTIAAEAEVPKYASELDLCHQARHAALRRIVGSLPLQPGQRVLDMACGDGTYAEFLSQCVGPRGLVIGADASEGYLKWARAKTDRFDGAPIELVAARSAALPFPDNAFDLVWCAQSLVSLGEPEAAVAGLRRVIRQGGWLAVMENDSLHELLLPWPEELELAVRQAELVAYRQQTTRPEARYMGRRLHRILSGAGYQGVEQRTFAFDRWPPFSTTEIKYLNRYLAQLRELTRPFLPATVRRNFDQVTDPDSDDYLARQTGLAITWLDVVCWGQKAPAEQHDQ